MSNFSTRLITSIALIVVFVGIFLLRAFVGDFGLYVFDVVILAAACAATWEICHAKNLNNRGSNAYIAFIVYGLVYLFFLIGSVALEQKLPWWLQILVSLIIVGIFALFIGLSNMLDKKFAKECRLQKKNLNHEAWCGAWDLVQVLLYPGLFFAFAIILNHLTDNHVGFFGLLLTMFVSCFADIFAYCVGMVLGKGTAKMAPKISPQKTWVGFIGSLFGGVLGALIATWIISADTVANNYLIQQFGDAWYVLLTFAVVGLIGAILTAIGDLYASYIKRKAGIKDYSNFLPGHGGVMDRLDGIIINIPFILLIMGII